MFHAVSLAADVEAAKVLAYSAPRLHEGVARIENAALELTAVIEPLRSVAPELASNLNPDDQAESEARYRFGVATMESQQIRVLTYRLAGPRRRNRPPRPPPLSNCPAGRAAYAVTS